MKIKQTLWAVLLPPKKNDGGIFDENRLAIGSECAVALYLTRKPAAAFARELCMQADLPGCRVVKVKATFKIKGSLKLTSPPSRSSRDTKGT